MKILRLSLIAAFALPALAGPAAIKARVEEPAVPETMGGCSLKCGFAWSVEVQADGETHFVHSVNTGVPHAVVFVEDLEGTDVRHLGHALRYHEHFAPKGTNANFVRQRAADTIAIRTYERGVEDETLACGTGMVACALIFHERTGAPSPVQVQVRGGETLRIGFTKTGDGYLDVTLTGPADFVFDGTVSA